MRRLDAFSYEARDAAETGVIERGPHRIRWSVSGNPRRMPIVVSHGGPGDQNKAFYRTLFDLDKWRMVQIDQPGNGVSEPAGEIAENTTQLSIRDMENLREQLGMEQWVVAGGSWGSTLSIAYAETLPERTRALFLFCMWLGESESLNFWFDAGQHIFPECYAEVVASGAIAGGFAANYLVKRNYMWLVWLPLISAVSVFPIYELAIFAPSPTIGLALIMLVNILGGVAFGPLLTATQTVVLPNMRASASAFVGFTSSVIGVGGGPFLVGVLSDCFAPTHGPAIGLQYALAIAIAVTLWGLFHYFFLIKSYPQDRLVPENLQEEDSQ